MIHVGFMLPVFLVYLIVFFLSLLWRVFLSLLNYYYVKKVRQNPPDFIDQITDRETYDRSVEYTLSRTRFGLISTVASSAFLITLILTGTLGKLETAITQWNLHLYTHGVIYVFFVSIGPGCCRLRRPA